MAHANEKVSNLVNYAVSEEHERPDLEMCLEISDRVNGTKPDCLEAIGAITKNLARQNLKSTLNTVQLLETLCKNCNMRFLYELNNKKLVDALMKTLAQRRERSKSTLKSIKPVDKLKLQVEDKILYLMQLWADTFMMHQAEFKNIHEAYRVLRKEGVKFPDRDLNEKFMISFQGQTSPIFLAMDDNYIVPSNNQGGPMSEPDRFAHSKYNIKPPEYKHEVTNSRPQNTLYNEDDEYDYSTYDGVEISAEEVKVLEESVNILKEIEANAVVPGDMKSEIANEILGDMVHVHKRIKRGLQSDKFTSRQTNDAIRLNDLINDCLTSYKERYKLLKENYEKGIKTDPIVSKPVRSADHDEDENGDYTNTKKAEIPKTKADYVGARKLAPPKGWKAPPEAQNNTPKAHVPDLLDLLDSDPVPVQASNNNQNGEEAKEGTQPKETKPKNLLDDLLDLNFDPQAQNVNKNNQQTGLNNFNLAQQSASQMQPQGFGFMGGFPQQFPTNPMPVTQPFPTVNYGYPQAYNQNAFNTVPVNMNAFPNPVMQGFPQPGQMFPPQQLQPNLFGSPAQASPITSPQVSSPMQQYGTSPLQPNLASPIQPQSSGQFNTNVQVNSQAAEKPVDDDDFFSDIANRQK